MPNRQLIERLMALGMCGMARALEEQYRQPEAESLTFDERLGLLIDREGTWREDNRLKSRLKKANLRQSACVEDVNYRHTRGLDKSLFMTLAGGAWLRARDNVFITGETGTGKTYLACALANKACRDGCSVLYSRTSRILEKLTLAKADGSYSKLLTALARIDLLVLDDWGITPLTDENRRDILEIMDDRYNVRSTLITSQLPKDSWHAYLNDPTLADAILDRLVHNAHIIPLKGGRSMRSKDRP